MSERQIVTGTFPDQWRSGSPACAVKEPPLRTPFHQPNERALQLDRRHLFELRDIVNGLGTRPRMVRHPDFIVFPAGVGQIPAEDV